LFILSRNESLSQLKKPLVLLLSRNYWINLNIKFHNQITNDQEEQTYNHSQKKIGKQSDFRTILGINFNLGCIK
jgi:hypothetical protein